MKGEIPSPIDPPPGCAFHPRCSFVFEDCRKIVPELIDGVACHAVRAGRIATGEPAQLDTVGGG